MLPLYPYPFSPVAAQKAVIDGETPRCVCEEHDAFAAQFTPTLAGAVKADAFHSLLQIR